MLRGGGIPAAPRGGEGTPSGTRWVRGAKELWRGGVRRAVRRPWGGPEAPRFWRARNGGGVALRRPRAGPEALRAAFRYADGCQKGCAQMWAAGLERGWGTVEVFKEHSFPWGAACGEYVLKDVFRKGCGEGGVMCFVLWSVLKNDLMVFVVLFQNQQNNKKT